MARPLAKGSSAGAPTALPTRANYHPARKLFHLLTGCFFASLNLSLPPPLSRVFFGALFGTVFCVEVGRIRAPTGALNRAVVRAFRPFIRAHETHQFAGIAYYTAGVLAATALFEPAVAAVGILALAAADPAAAAAATFFEPRLPGLRLRHGKSLAGPVCGSLAASLLLAAVILAGGRAAAEQPPATIDAAAAAAARVAAAAAAGEAGEIAGGVPPFVIANATVQLPADAFMVAVIVAWVAALVEFAVPTPQRIIGPKSFPVGIDDNALIPVIAAAACQGVLTLSHRKLHIAPLLFWGSP